MIDMGEEYKVLANILKVFYAIGEKMVALDPNVRICDDDRIRSYVTHDGSITSIHSIYLSSNPIKNNANLFIRNMYISTNQ